MDLSFEIGDRNFPKGHALLYFVDSLGDWYATYIVLLPVTVDVSKYVPPFLMNQVDDLIDGGVCDMFDVASAMSKVNEAVESYLELYSDDLFVREEIPVTSGSSDDGIHKKEFLLNHFFQSLMVHYFLLKYVLAHPELT